MRTRLLNHWNSLSPTGRARLVLGLALSGVVLFLLFAPKPWMAEEPIGARVTIGYCVMVYSWWGGAIVLAGLIALLATAHWWMRPLPSAVLQAAEAERALSARRTPRWFWPLVGAAMMVTAVAGCQRLGFSMWDDEIYNLRRFVHGDYRTNDDGTVRFREKGWGSTFQDYRKPNNHILHSVLARLSVGVWKIFRDPAGLPFSEVAFRVPAFLFGIASVGALAWLLKELALVRAGVLAAFLMAFHPWHLRYASEGRGYSMVLFFLPVLLVCWLRAMRTGQWRWWIATGAAQFALLYTYPAIVYPILALNIATFVLLLARRPLQIAPWVPAGRWLVSSAVAAMAFLWLFLPCVPQLQHYISEGGIFGDMGWKWVRNFGSHVFAGASWFRSADPSSHHPELYKMSLAHPLLFAVLTASAAGLAVVGLARWCSRGWLTAACAVVLTLPALAAYFVSLRTSAYLYEWYLLYLLIGAVGFVATGLDTLSWPWRHAHRSWLVPTSATALLLAGYLVMVQDAHRWLLTRSLQPLREAAIAARGTILPNYEGHSRVATTGWPLDLYDPHGTDLGSFEDFLALLRRCDEQDVTLYVHFGFPQLAIERDPAVFLLATKSPYFEVVEELPGYDPSLDRIVCRYRRGSLAAGFPAEGEWSLENLHRIDRARPE
jgi:hypothetical protein